jgi:hypothetical protein
MAMAVVTYSRRAFYNRSAAMLGFSLLPSARAAPSLFAPFESVKTVLDAFGAGLPRELANSTPSKWNVWNRKNDQAIRARLELGDLDTLVNFLLFGTSFTSQPRIHLPDLAGQAREGVLKARVGDLVRGLSAPGNNERLVLLRKLVKRNVTELDTTEGQDKAGRFVLENLTRVLKEKQTFAARSASQAGSTLDERSGLFRDRGVSLDTGILADFSIDIALRRLKERGVLVGRPSMRVGVIGPGLNFIDKDESSAFDYYPLQTLQPFALLDSLRQLKLGDSVELTVFDISPLVLEHFQRARQQAQKGIGYTIQLPQDAGHSWPGSLEDYWGRLGATVGKDIPPLAPPAVFAGLRSRAVEIRPDVVAACQAEDLDIIAQRPELNAENRFDLIVATNIFVYYGAFEQALAMQNVSAMLRPGGILLANDELPVLPASEMELAGGTSISDGAAGRDAVVAYRKK